MSDRVPTFATVYTCPVGSEVAAAQVILDADLTELGPEIGPDGEGLVQGRLYYDPNVEISRVEEIAHGLMALGCTFSVGHDAREDYQGQLWRGVPALGLHRAAYHDGTVLVADRSITSALESATSLAELGGLLHDLMGTKWEEAIAPLRVEGA